MTTVTKTTWQAWGAFLCGVLSLGWVVLALLTQENTVLIGFGCFWALALVLKVLSVRAIEGSGGRLRGLTLGCLGLVIPLLGVLGLCLLPVFCMVEEAGARVASAGRLQQIALALISYSAEHEHRLPPAAVYDKAGRPILSWRVLILPYLEQGDLYKEFHLDEPWDGPHNLPLLSRMPAVYAPPEARWLQPAPDATYYQVFLGQGTPFEGRKGVRYPQDFPDGVSSTILVAEAGEPVLWSKPEDLAYWAHKPLPLLGGIFPGKSESRLALCRGPKGFHVALADGSAHWVGPGVSEATLRSAITRNDGKPLGPDW